MSLCTYNRDLASPKNMKYVGIIVLNLSNLNALQRVFMRRHGYHVGVLLIRNINHFLLFGITT